MTAFARANNVPPDQILNAADSKAGKAFMRTALAPKVRDAMLRNVSSRLGGSRLVRLEVTVTQFDIVPTAQRLLIGGAANSMTADVNIVDAKTGQLILTYPKLMAAVPTGGGVVGVVVQAMVDAADKVIDNFAARYGRWLVESS